MPFNFNVLFIQAIYFLPQIIYFFHPYSQVTHYFNLNHFNFQYYYFLDKLEFSPSLLNFHSKFAIAACLLKNLYLGH